ncbi:hypothetical protein [Fulvivirga lutea]|uniref:Uncharacterized protein n=1 Tax=Fulvivirga lutea TaxID=2810512 RepID=A0A974WHW3_9BACT|nr:hypothetical protein [Fulvivirga lutea]QSE98864.1 hypothetical protein JR347_07225 [Fulvivirga lutea]
MRNFFGLLVTFIVVLIIWTVQDKMDFDEYFIEETGEFQGFYFVPDVSQKLLLNNKTYLVTKSKLHDSGRIFDKEIDSLVNQYRATLKLPDTLSTFSKEVWDKYFELTKSKRKKWDTTLYSYQDSVKLTVEYEVFFDPQYLFKCKDYYYSLSPSTLGARLDGKLRDTEYSEFKKYVEQCNKTLNVNKGDLLTIYIPRSDHLLAQKSKRVTMSAYIINTADGDELFRNTAGFEMLTEFEEYMTWHDSIIHLIIAGTFIIGLVITFFAGIGNRIKRLVMIDHYDK